MATPVPTGALAWASLALDLLPGDDPAARLAALLPPVAVRRDTLVRVVATGRTGLGGEGALVRALAAVEHDFAFLEAERSGLAVDHAPADLEVFGPRARRSAPPPTRSAPRPTTRRLARRRPRRGADRALPPPRLRRRRRMKLRSITLTNVRRFAGTTVTLDGLGDGLNLVCAPNEAGKSTFFEALQALVFTAHRSAGAEVRALRPYAGGAPEVAAEVEVGGTGYRVTKRWLQRPFARVAERASGRIIAQDDEAERWIAARIAGDGPAELLWVRQGTLALEPEGRTPAEKAEQERLGRIRRDLLSSVARELDAVTGGRRLDAIAARCGAELGELATPGGKAKASGRWGQAEKEAADLRDELARLESQCADLAAALDERAALRERLADARDPAAARARAAAGAVAERAVEAAHLHRSRLDAARAAQRAAVARARRGRRGARRPRPDDGAARRGGARGRRGRRCPRAGHGRAWRGRGARGGGRRCQGRGSRCPCRRPRGARRGRAGGARQRGGRPRRGARRAARQGDRACPATSRTRGRRRGRPR